MKIRLGNIECRFSQERYEIVKWYPNSYFGAEERNPESCYTIATLHYDKSEGCCMEWVGPRLLGLNKKDCNEFFKVYKIAEKNIRKELKD